MKTKEVQFKETLGLADENVECALISKVKPVIVTEENCRKVIRFFQFNSSPLNELYQTIHSVYAPLLHKTRDGDEANLKIQKLLDELQNGLSMSLKEKKNTNPSEYCYLNSALSEYDYINSYTDECEYWLREAKNATKGKKERDMAAYYSSQFCLLKEDYDNINSLPFSDLIELSEKTHDILHAIWGQELHPEYSQARMEHLLDAIGVEFIKTFTARLSKLQLFADPINIVFPGINFRFWNH